MRVFFLCVAGLVLWAASCVSPTEYRVRHIGQLMDPVGRSLDEFGTVSVSSPLFADARKVREAGGFDFDLTAGPDDYFKFAREEVQGGVATFHQRAAETRGGLQIRANLQNLLENQLMLGGYEEELAAFRRKRMLRDTSELMGLLLPIIDPSLALKLPEGGPALPAGDGQPPEGEAQPPDEQPRPGEPPAGEPVTPSDATGETPSDDSADPGTSGEPAAADGGEPAGDQAEERVALTPEEERTARLRDLIDALSGASTGVSGSETRPPIPAFKHEPPAVDPAVLADTDLVKQVIAGEKLSNFQALLKDLSTVPPKVAARSAILTSAGDTMVESIMRFLGRPVLANDWKDKIVLMGVSMVSVAPGSRTMRGYVADVSVTCTYVYQPARPSVIQELLDRKDDHLEQLVLAVTNTLTATKPELMQAWDDVRRSTMDVEQLEHALRAAENSDAERAAQTSRLENARHGLAVSRQLLGQLLMASSETSSETVRTGTAGRRFANLCDVTKAVDGSWQLRPAANWVRNPVVSAASPMTETQTLDLASSIREQQAFAFRLALVVSGFGSEAQAQGLTQYIERLEQDAATRSAMNTVAAYSNSGGMFGYQIGPSLVGIADFLPGGYTGGAAGILGWLLQGSYRPGPDFTLQRQSFPVLVFIGMNKDDLRLMVQCDQGRTNCYVVEPSLEFRQTSRWIPIPHSEADRNREPRPIITESQRVRWAFNLEEARRTMEGLPDEYTELREYVDYRTHTLASHALHAYSYQTLPLELLVFEPQQTLAPQVLHVTPDELHLRPKPDSTECAELENAPVVVLGSDLGGVRSVTAHVLDRRADETVEARLSGAEAPVIAVTLARVRVPTRREPAVVQLRFEFEDGRTLVSPGITIHPCTRP